MHDARCKVGCIMKATLSLLLGWMFTENRLQHQKYKITWICKFKREREKWFILNTLRSANWKTIKQSSRVSTSQKVISKLQES